MRPADARRRRWLGAAPAIALLCGLSALAARNLVADGPQRDASAAVAAWSAAPGHPPEPAWSAIHEPLVRSAHLLASSPVVHELLGLVKLTRMDDERHLREAANHFRNALRLRPHSAHTWAALVQTQYVLGDTGGLFELALVRCAQLGPAEPAVQRVAADYGLAMWEHLSPEAREAVDRLMAAGVRRDAAEMLQIAQRRGRLGLACRHLEGAARATDSKVSGPCRSREALP